VSSGVGAVRGERTWPGAGDGWVTHAPLSLFCFPPVIVFPFFGSAHTNSAGSVFLGALCAVNYIRRWSNTCGCLLSFKKHDQPFNCVSLKVIHQISSKENVAHTS